MTFSSKIHYCIRHIRSKNSSYHVLITYIPLNKNI